MTLRGLGSIVSTNSPGGHMNTLLLPETRRRRQHHSPEFKVQVIAACLQPGVSIAAIALANQLNANLVRRWVREHERRQIASIEPRVAGEENVSTSLVPPPASFVPVEVPPPVVNSEAIRLELRRNGTVLNIAWPITQVESCALLLRELLR